MKILVVKDFIRSENNKFIYCSPFYTISCIDNDLIFRISQIKKILITSKNGAVALLRNITTFDCNEIKHKEIITVGSKTRDLLDTNGFLSLHHSYYNIQSLTEKINLNGVLYLSGADTAFLDYQSYGVKREVVYKSIERKISLKIVDQIMNGSISHILLYSRRGAVAFLKNFPEHYNFNWITFICISQSVSEVVAKYNVKYPNLPIEKEMLSLIS